MLKINDLNDLKITNIKKVIHFRYNNKYYFIHQNWKETCTTAIYEGRTKYKNECLKSIYGYINGLIKYKNNKKVLSAIDKQNFVEKLYRARLIETDIKEIVEKTEWKNKRCEELRKIIKQAQDELIEINW